MSLYNRRIKHLLLILIFVSSSVFSASTVNIGNLSVTVTDRNQVEVYKGEDHKFSVDCWNIRCQVFVATTKDPEYSLSDGHITPISGLLPLKIENIQSFKPSEYSEDKYIAFLVSNASASSTSLRQSLFLINIKDGSYSRFTEEYDWMRYGSPDAVN
jgi:hypothetical protein